MEKVLAFDLEIVKEIPEGENMEQIRPLGISCVALLPNDEALSQLFYHVDDKFQATSGAMTKEELESVMVSMEHWVDKGYKILTWNGLKFDFDILAEESGEHEKCKALAMSHLDMAFHFLCTKGYMIGLNTAADGLGLSGKMGGMEGSLAPIYWASPNLRDRLRVLRYVNQDVVTTLEVYEQSSETKKVPWTSRSGKPNALWLNDGWKTIKECMDFPKVDTSWMDNPITKESCYDWTNK